MKTLTLFGVVLLMAAFCPRSASGQTPVFDFSTLNSDGPFVTQDSATTISNRLRLTPAQASRTGAGWYRLPRYIEAGFQSTFTFQLGAAGGGGGEGFAFVLLGSALPAVGPAGSGLGYAGVPNCLAVEFDSTDNAGLPDALPGHVSVQSKGTLPNAADITSSLGSAAWPANLADGNVHTGRVVYVPGSLKVFIDGAGSPLLDVPVNLGSLLALVRGQAWLGFTAATGAGFRTQDILSWSLDLAANPVTSTLTGPMDGGSFLSPAFLQLTTSVGSSNGPIALVEFHEGSRRIGVATNSPWSFLWQNVQPGSYRVTATAIDSTGATNISAPVEVLVISSSASVGINFSTGSNGTNYLLQAADTAGVIPQHFWNTATAFTNGNSFGQSLRDGFGLPTRLSYSFDFAAPAENPGISATNTDDTRLMKAYLADHAGTPGFQTNSVITISQVPFAIYDVLVYSDGDNAGADRVAQFRIGTQTNFLRDAAWTSFSGIYRRAAGTNDAGSATPAGNYVRFNSIQTNQITLTVTAGTSSDGTRRAAVNAIQIIPSIFDASTPPALTRGPYIQSTTPRSTIIRWRTNRPVQGRVNYGTNAAMLDVIVDDATLTSEHIVTLTNLDANTRYYYSIGTPDATLAMGADYYFQTHPTNAKPTRIWVIGDAGTGTANQMAVRDAYYTLAGGQHTDVWLMMGDDAYNSGTDGEFQTAVFNMYPTLLRKTAAWSAVGNHETAQNHNPNIATVPYFNIFSFPVNGEAGGVSSGTERYYSFDYGSIHFVCLDAMTSVRTPEGPMAQWLVSDLQANTNKWLIAYWHHPPYTKGSHDSDNPNGADFELVEMRENILPILESYGVDLVLSGHSHCYERSVLLNGHYGYSTSITPANILNGGLGNDVDGFYTKTAGGPTPYAGTVYSVVGSSGQATFGTLDHPAMKVSLLNLGSMVIDVDGNQLRGRFLREIGEIQDDFTIVKTPPAPSVVFRVNSIGLANNTVTLRWQTLAGRQYKIQHTTNLITPTWLDVVGSTLTASGGELTWNGPAPGGTTGFYRIVQIGE